ncbi:MAG TPA: NAD(+)/NADH kinase [Acidimicrobiia bacterium]|nr:NAD(+)/NADH kinase [Acidimicrobiia bacterium]
MSTPITAVGIVAHRERPRALALARECADWLQAHGVAVRVPKDVAAAADLGAVGVESDGFASGLGLVLSLGGDGTMLHTVQLVYPQPVPLLGVNVGQLGYLNEVEPHELLNLLPRLVAGDFAVSERMMLSVSVMSEGAAHGEWFALNEAALEKPRAGHLIRLEMSINGSAFTSYAADGMILATPTGSTAYAFSARGPIVSPALRCLLVAPISPHMLFDRSLVLGPTEEVELRVSEGRSVFLTLDGRELGELLAGDRVRAAAATEPLRLASVAPRDFHQILKHKFELPDR